MERHDVIWTLEPISFMYQEQKIVQLYKVTKSKKITPTFHSYLSVRTIKVKTK